MGRERDMMAAMEADETDQVTQTRQSSVYQQAIYDDVARGVGHTVVRARAGAGKTTTIMGALSSVPRGRTVALFAFNRSIAQELGRRAPKGVEVKTLHSHGFSAVRRAFPGVRLDDGKSVLLCQELLGLAVKEHPIRGRYAAVAALVTKAKDLLVGADDLASLDEIIDEFGIDAPSEDDDDEIALPEEFANDSGTWRGAFVAFAMRVLKRSAEVSDRIDFADMCWLPVVLRLRVWAFDRVFVDETQDLSPSQIELLLMCCRPGGRITVVGDDRQAIYAFRGADVNTIPNLIERLSAKVLPLSVTYRCCRSVVRLAQSEVPDLEACEGAPEGRVVAGVRLDSVISNALPGDMVVSRTNAPLLGICLKLLRSGKRATIKGRDVGAGIVRLIEKARAKTVEELDAWLVASRDKEIARLVKRERPTDEVEDRYACVAALLEDASTVEEVLARAKTLFSKEDEDAAGAIVLGTTHKLKGLEAGRVWMLDFTYRRGQDAENDNCWYVAVSRAKTELFLVSKDDEEARS